MKLNLEELGMVIDTGVDLRSVYEAFGKPASERQMNERVIRHLSMMTVLSVLLGALKEIGDERVDNPSDFAYKALHEALKFSPEFVADEIGYEGYGKAH